MKIMNSMSVLALLTTMSCGSFGTQSAQMAGVQPDAMNEWVKPFEYPTTSRKPTSEVQGKPTYHWEADTLKIPVTAGATIDHDFKVTYKQFASYVTKEKVVQDVPKLITEWQRVTQGVLVCDEKAGAGKSQYWNDFYSAPAAKKPAALAKAIEGVSTLSAANLIKAGYFQQKPRSWSELTEEILKARDTKVITGSVAYSVIYKYRQENMTKLGYNTQATGLCRIEVETYDVPVEKWINVKEVSEKLVNHSDLINTEVKLYRIKISGQKLQAFETDTLVFSFDRETNAISLAQAAYNTYSVSLAGNTIKVTGSGRKRIDLPRDVLLPGATLEASNGVAGFSALVNTNYIPKSAQDGQLYSIIQVRSCKKGLFASTCSLTNRDEKLEAKVVNQVKGAVIRHTFPKVPGRVYWVRYAVQAINSPWYANNSVIASKEPAL
jgi:hypothetical protein